MDGIGKDITGIALAIISLATLAVLVRQGNNTVGVIQAGTSGFANVLGTAMGTR
ncbi:MAG: hypothetical protein EO766_16975 [Hydrotalea sp. AMD]|nr:MAG: hypothetical protein EO766_16975 [Hydrotalea sp. AMD]